MRCIVEAALWSPRSESSVLVVYTSFGRTIDLMALGVHTTAVESSVQYACIANTLMALARTLIVLVARKV